MSKRCKHPSLSIEAIQIAERCPSCYRYITSSGKSYATIGALLAAVKPKQQKTTA